MEKTKEANQKFGKIGQIISQALTLGPKHDRIWAQWVSNILPESMLEKVFVTCLEVCAIMGNFGQMLYELTIVMQMHH